MEQLLAEFKHLSTTYPNCIKPQPIEQVERVVKSNAFLKKDLLVTLDVPVGISHARLPPVAHLVCDISFLYIFFFDFLGFLFTIG
jgi:hypothetical protein